MSNRCPSTERTNVLLPQKWKPLLINLNIYNWFRHFLGSRPQLSFSWSPLHPADWRQRVAWTQCCFSIRSGRIQTYRRQCKGLDRCTRIPVCSLDSKTFSLLCQILVNCSQPVTVLDIDLFQVARLSMEDAHAIHARETKWRLVQSSEQATCFTCSAPFAINR